MEYQQQRYSNNNNSKQLCGAISLLNPDLWQLWLPVLIVIAGLSVVHELFKLRIGNWTPALTLTNVILGIVSIAYIVAFVTTQEVINPAFLETLTDSPAISDTARWARWSVNISAAITIGIYVWDMVNSIIMAKRLNSPEPKNAIATEKMLKQ